MVYGTALVLTGLIAVVCFLKPGTTPWLPPCQFYKLTGLYCPGCGSTRMLYFLVHGHPWLAFRQNALAMIVLPGVIYGLVLQVIKPASAVYSRISPRWMTTFCLVLRTTGKGLTGVRFSFPVVPEDGCASRKESTLCLSVALPCTNRLGMSGLAAPTLQGPTARRRWPLCGSNGGPPVSGYPPAHADSRDDTGSRSR